MLYCFEAFELDVPRRELRQAGRCIAIEPQVFDLLEFLIRNRDRVVTKDDMIAVIWGGRIVSESTLTSRINSARSALGDNGKDQRLIKTMRHRGLRFVGAVSELPDGGASAHGTTAAARKQPPNSRAADTPSIVVLPFANLSDDPAQSYFADGMVEDITLALGRFSWLFVIASASAFTYKDRIVDVRQVGVELGVRYVLQGSVRRDGNRIRIAVQLADTANGRQLLGERFEGHLEEIFSIQERVAMRLSAAIAPALRLKDAARARREPTTNLTAYDLFLRALPPRRDDPAQNEESLRLLYKAIELDPLFSTAYGLAAWCYEIQSVFGWRHPSDGRLKEGLRFAYRVVELGDDDAEALWMAGLAVTTLAGDIARGAALIDKSLSINPSSARAWWASGVARTYLGQSDIALANFARSQDLNPLDTAAYAHWTAVATTHFFAGDYQTAQDTLRQALIDWPDAPPALRLNAALCGILGCVDEGRSSLHRLLALVPNTTLSGIKAHFALLTRGNGGALEAITAGLRRSGLADDVTSRQSNVARLRSF
jgi:TolB-like protein